MTVTIRNAYDNSTSLPALQRSGERVEKGVRKVSYDNLDQSGVSLASAKSAELGLKLPQDRMRGSIMFTYQYREPLADRSDGTARFGVFTGIGFVPADATQAERDLIRARFGDVVGSGDAYIATHLLMAPGL